MLDLLVTLGYVVQVILVVGCALYFLTIKPIPPKK